MLYAEFHRRARQFGWTKGLPDPIEPAELDAGKERMKAIHGRVPHSARDFVYWRADCKRALQDDARLWEVVNELTDDLDK
jgi:hypothetical protein